MTAPLATFNLSAPVNGVTGPVNPGDVLVPVGGVYVVATPANLAAAGERAHGVAVTGWSANTTGAVTLQHVGIVPTTVSGLGAGAASFLRVSSAGRLERATTSGSDDVVGRCDADGNAFVLFGILTAAIVNGGGGGFTPPTGTGVVSATGGVLNTAASAVVSVNEAGQELDVVTANQSTMLRAINYASSANGANVMLQHARGTVAAPTAVASGDQLGGFYGRGYYADAGGGFGSAAAGVRAVATDSFSSTTQGASIAIVAVPVGSATAREVGRFNADGTTQLYNPAGTYYYALATSAITASRTITLPLLTANDTFVFQAFAQTLTNKTISGASNTLTVRPADITPSGTNGQVLTTTGGVPVWAAPTGGSGSPGGSSGQMQFNNAGAFGGADMSYVSGTGYTIATNNTFLYGTDNGATTHSLIGIDSSNYFTLGGGLIQIGFGADDAIFGTLFGNIFRGSSAGVGFSVPVTGLNGPWGAVDGLVQVAVSTVNITLSASQYNTHAQKFTGAPAATRAITYPAPADDAHAYTKLCWCATTVSGLTIGTGGGATVSLAAGSIPRVVLFTTGGAF